MEGEGFGKFGCVGVEVIRMTADELTPELQGSGNCGTGYIVGGLRV